MKKIIFTTILFLIYSNLILAQWSIDSLSTPAWGLASTQNGTKAILATSGKYDLYDFSNASWSSHNMVQPRPNVKAATANGFSYFGGGGFIGRYSYNFFTDVDIYNSNTGNWSETNLSIDRIVGASAGVGNKVLFAGGRQILNYSNRVDIFNVTTGARTIAALSQPRAGIAVAVVGSKVLFAGGETGDIISGIYTQSNKVDIYNDATGTWSTALLSVKREQITAAVVGTKVLFAGGIDVNGLYSSVIDIYDAATNTWSVMNMSEPKYGISAATAGNKVYLAGGSTYNTGSLSSRVEIFDATTGTLSYVTLSSPRMFMSAAQTPQRIMFAGGNVTWGNTGTDRVEVLNLFTNTWSVEYLSRPRFYMAAVSYGDKALFAGGAEVLSSYAQYSVISKRVDIWKDYSTLNLSTTGTNTTCGGVGSVNLAINGGVGPYTFIWSNGAVTQNISGVTAGTYTVNVTDALGATGFASYTVLDNTPPSKPATPGVIGGATKICKDSVYTYSIANVANASSYTWTPPLNANIISGQGTTTVVLKYLPAYTNGTISVKAVNCVGSSAAKTLSVSLLPAPAMPGTITGVKTVCPGTYSYTIAPVTNATGYSWSAPAGAGITGGQGTTTAQVTFNSGFVSGNITVAATNCTGTSGARAFAASTAPAIPGLITGPINNICGTTTGILYYVMPVAGITSYTWVLTGGVIVSGQGTNAVYVDFPATFTSATLKVKANSPCLSSAYRSLTVYQKPATPAVITGNNLVCPGIDNVYSVVATPGVSSYTWTVPSGWTIVSGQGTPTLTVTAGTIGGTLKVVAANACKTSAAKTLIIAINPGCRSARQPFTAAEAVSVPDFTIYPNPVTGNEVFVQLKTTNKNARLQIFDLLGHKLIQKENIQSGKTAINISSLKNGVYLVELEDGLIIKTERLEIRK